MRYSLIVIPAEAGTHNLEPLSKIAMLRVWVPASAGMTMGACI